MSLDWDLHFRFKNIFLIFAAVSFFSFRWILSSQMDGLVRVLPCNPTDTPQHVPGVTSTNSKQLNWSLMEMTAKIMMFLSCIHMCLSLICLRGGGGGWDECPMVRLIYDCHNGTWWEINESGWCVKSSLFKWLVIYYNSNWCHRSVIASRMAFISVNRVHYRIGNLSVSFRHHRWMFCLI